MVLAYFASDVIVISIMSFVVIINNLEILPAWKSELMNLIVIVWRMLKSYLWPVEYARWEGVCRKWKFRFYNRNDHRNFFHWGRWTPQLPSVVTPLLLTVVLWSEQSKFAVFSLLKEKKLLFGTLDGIHLVITELNVECTRLAYSVYVRLYDCTNSENVTNSWSND